jgi:hypothetical protein
MAARFTMAKRNFRNNIAKSSRSIWKRSNKKSIGVPVKSKKIAEKILSKDRNKIFLKKIIEKRTKFESD